MRNSAGERRTVGERWRSITAAVVISALGATAAASCGSDEGRTEASVPPSPAVVTTTPPGASDAASSTEVVTTEVATTEVATTELVTTEVATTDASAATAPLPLGEAAAAAQAAIDLGDDLGSCPFGPLQAVVAVIPPEIDLAPGFATAGIEDDGQVFSGGEADITYCNVRPDDSSDGIIDTVRIDVAPGQPLLADYLYEEVGMDEDEMPAADGFHEGEVHAGCEDERRCVATWQGDGLFVATIVDGDGPVTIEDATTILEAAIPVVVTNLARPDKPTSP